MSGPDEIKPRKVTVVKAYGVTVDFTLIYPVPLLLIHKWISHIAATFGGRWLVRSILCR